MTIVVVLLISWYAKKELDRIMMVVDGDGVARIDVENPSGESNARNEDEKKADA